MHLIVSLIALLFAGAGITFMFNNLYIPTIFQIVITAGIQSTLIIVIVLFKQPDGKAYKRLIILANTLFIVMIAGSLVYQHWQWDSLVSNLTMMKICLGIFGTIGFYVNFMYSRAAKNLKEKRGNKRIKNAPKNELDEIYSKYKKDLKGYLKKNKEIIVKIGESLEHKDTPILLKEKDFLVHSLIVGATGSGKTFSTLEPIAYQLLVQKKIGKKLGLTVIEPKRDFALEVKNFCDHIGIPYIFIDPLSPDTNKFNPMEGDINDVAEATVVVLKGLFGKQEAFFATVQELSARNVTKLLKELHGDDMDIIDVMNKLRDIDELKKKVQELKARDGVTDLVHFFESELLGQQAEKYRQFVIGLRAQLENITSNDLLKRIMTGKSDVNIHKHFEEGGVLIVNTELGKLGTAGDAFGQFIIMHLQNGTFNRPGPKEIRIPHFLIADEYSRYINPEIERFLSIARSYMVAGIFAVQSAGQLELESGKISAKAMKQSILINCRNKIVYGGVGVDDAEEFAKEFGKDKVIMRQSTYKNRIFMPVLFPDSYRDTELEEFRFDATDIMDGLPAYSYIHKIVYEGQVQKPSLAKGNPVPRNWKEKKEWEKSNMLIRILQIGTGGMKKMKFLLNERKTISESEEKLLNENENKDKSLERDSVQKEAFVTNREARRKLSFMTNTNHKSNLSSTQSNNDVDSDDKSFTDTASSEKTHEHESKEQSEQHDNNPDDKTKSQPVSQSSDGFWD
ncbi:MULTISPECIES: type IV secretory system conjugative DNA transfer family protein [Oceanobacillus]|uniref:type IV secretory system conjugative DNA transfer family protein n=1 Tax=Oceanobacillus TaxID=182709 RepID=UPI0006941B2A|nr:MULTISPECIES: TraM recognition domain-containing protein [Oceanobacillus]